MKRKLLFLSVLLVSQFVAIRSEAQVIQFADANVKALCVANWDTNGDGELSKGEASAVTSLSRVFERNGSIASFDELEYFTGLTTIENAAFEYCSGLTSVTIPNSVTSIGSFAFSDCSSLASVTIPNNVTSIGKRAFYNCSGLTSVSIGNGVTTVGEGAFYKCSGLTAVHIMDLAAWCSISNNAGYNALYYAQHLFLNGVEITNLVIPDGVASIGFYAFEGCKNITSVTIPNSVRSIGGQAFYGCDAIESVVSMIETPFEMYNVNFSLSVYSNALLTVPAGTKAKYQATDGWKNFTNIVEAGDQELSFEETRANFMEELEKIYTNDYLPVKNTLEQEAKWTEMNTAYSDVSQKLNQLETKLAQSDLTDAQKAVITEKIDAVRATFQQAVSGMDRYALSDNQLKMVYNRILDVNAAAMNATTVEELTQLNNSLDQLKAMTAQALNMIAGAMQQTPPATILGQFETLKAQIATISEEIDLAEAILEVGDVFTEVTKEGVTMTFVVTSTDPMECQVGNGQKASISTNTSGDVTIPDKPRGFVTRKIAAYGFAQCSRMKHCWVNDSIWYIGAHAFDGCTSLTTIDLPKKIREIAPDFTDTPKNINTPQDVPSNVAESIRKASEKTGSSVTAKRYNKKDEVPERVFIWEYVRGIEDHFIAYCVSVNRIEVDTKNMQFDSRDNCNAIISSDNSTLLFGCKTTKVPASIKAIAAYAFEGHSGLMEVNIPAGVTFIGEQAFVGCTMLMKVTSYIKQPFAIADNTFTMDTYEDGTLFVPYGTKEDYLSTDGWKNFKHIVEMEPENTPGDLSGDNEVNGTDLVMLTQLVLNAEYNAVADLNNDGVVNGTDFVLMVNIILNINPATAREESRTKALTAGLAIEDFTIRSGETRKLLISLINPDTRITLGQFDLRLPAGLSIVSEDGEMAVSIAGRTSERRHALSTLTRDGVTRFLLASDMNEPVSGTDGAVISVTVTASSDFCGGDILLENQLLVTPEADEIKPVNYTYTLGAVTGVCASAVDGYVEVFTMTGSKVNTGGGGLKALPKGVYIVNGKKVIVK